MPMYDINSLEAAGIPLSKKLLKYSNSIDQNGNAVTPNLLKFNLNYDSLFSIMRQQNMIETLERYMWVALPPGITADLIERVLFFRGKGLLYYNDEVDKFQFLPFVLNGPIDEYGRYLSANTLPFAGVNEEESDKDKKKKPVKYIKENIPIVYDLPTSEEDIERVINGDCVGIIINDSSLAISQQPVIRSNYVQPILHLLATLIQIINTSIYGCADTNLLQVDNESEYASICQQISAINQAILHGERFVPIQGTTPITPLRTSNTADLEGLFNTFNSVTNLLKSITGVANPGVFDKKAHLLQEEQALNGSNADDIYYNGLRQRQEAMLLFQAYYDFPTWCESKRGMSEAQEENYLMGETSDPDNTQQNTTTGGNDSGSDNA